MDGSFVTSEGHGTTERRHASIHPGLDNENKALAEAMKGLSLDTPLATPLPPSPLIINTKDVGTPSRRVSSSSTNASPRLLRDSSNMPPQLTLNNLKRTSMTSMHGRNGTNSPRVMSRRASSVSQASTPSIQKPYSSPTTAKQSLSNEPPLTAAAAAKAYFEREVQRHIDGQPPTRQSDTVVILHDSCYGHRYSRPRTSKAALSTIVERPERLQAAALGVATAYVRLGDRYSKELDPVGWMDDIQEGSVPFRIYRSTRTIPLSSTTVTNVHGAKWMNELKGMCETAEAKLEANGKELVRQEVADEDEEKPRFHEGDLYLCGRSLEALEGTLGAVCDGVDAVFQAAGTLDSGHTRKAFVCVRPPGHHCSSNYPSGFCWLNNVHVGISYAATAYDLTHAAIIDFDLHHGDGSQSIAWAHNDGTLRLPKKAPSHKRCNVGYFSLHDINSYPCEMGDEDKVRNASVCVENAHGQTVWNVHLQPWQTPAEFWELYESRYVILLDKARSFLKNHTLRLSTASNHPTPRAAIFLSAGFDASEWEGAGMQRHKVNVPTDFYARFTEDVVALANEDDLAVDGRVISVLEGGYSDRALSSGIFSHVAGLAGTQARTEKIGRDNGLGYEMSQRIEATNIQDTDGPNSVQHSSYDPSWWNLQHLEELEALMKPPASAPPSRRPRVATPPTYTSTTQSFTAKVVTSPKPYRSVSGSGMHSRLSTTKAESASLALPPPPLPPPPTVDWATAAFELSKLLIPTDRPTGSCRPEELSVEASRACKARHSSIESPRVAPRTSGPSRMGLRDRKGRTPNYVEDDEDDADPAAASRAHRRRTVASAAIIKDQLTAAGATLPDIPTRTTTTARRRSSASLALTAATESSRVPPVPSVDAAAAAIARQTREPKNSNRPAPAKRVPPDGIASTLDRTRAGAIKGRAPKKAVPTPASSRPSTSGSVNNGQDAVPAATAAANQHAPESVPTSTLGSNDVQEVDQLTERVVRLKLNPPRKPDNPNGAT